ncbi:hypothetical protein E5288_WYG016697 [Bos mutus]|uniref:Uncharacterized protein n=1 Tax=Bos mutus TaxID=72004 RepID=A0A6B0RB96_9CETA|nr:hypothetical protein [Bos mutus]
MQSPGVPEVGWAPSTCAFRSDPSDSHRCRPLTRIRHLAEKPTPRTVPVPDLPSRRSSVWDTQGPKKEAQT